jgi:hypothetical protein
LLFVGSISMALAACVTASLSSQRGVQVTFARPREVVFQRPPAAKAA